MEIRFLFGAFFARRELDSHIHRYHFHDRALAWIRIRLDHSNVGSLLGVFDFHRDLWSLGLRKWDIDVLCLNHWYLAKELTDSRSKHSSQSGNLGILFGLGTIGVGILCMVMQFTKWRNELPIMHMNFGNAFNKYSFMVDNEVILSFARGLAFVLSVTTMVIGLIHVLTSNFTWCPTAGANGWTECVGPSLRWNSGQHGFLYDANGDGTTVAGGVMAPPGWRSVFTFDPELFMPLWGPIIFGYIGVLQHLEGRQWLWLYGSWPRVCLFWCFMALWCNFGICGTLGVITGFASITECLLALLISFGGAQSQRTGLLIRVAFPGGKN